MALSNKTHGLKLLIIGLDGATPQVFFPLLEGGKLPAFSMLLQNGVRGNLESTIPPLTPTAWTTMMTGVSPASHGLFDFIALKPGSYDLQFTNVRSRRAPSIWRLLNERGYRVGVFNVPMTYPPEKVDAFLISGLDTPDPESDFVYPSELKKELRQKFGRIPLDPRHLGYMRTDELRLKALNELKEIERLRLEIFKYLLEKHQLDVAMIVFTATDTVQHFFWHYFDPSHPWHGDTKKGYDFHNAVNDIYCHIDGLVGSLLRLPEIGPDTQVMVMSDHGFGPTGVDVFYPNRLLSRLGLLDVRTPAAGCLSWMDNLLRRAMPPSLKTMLAARMPALRSWWEQQASALKGINWSRTRAFALEILALPLGYWINDRNRFPQGTVKDSLEYERVCREIIAALKEYNITGIHKKEIFSGPYLDFIPDIIIDWWSSGLTFGRSFPASPDAPVKEKRVWRPDQPASWTGTHALEGIFMLSGAKVSSLSAARPRMIDLAPTVFALLDEPIPSHFEGHPMSCVAGSCGVAREERAIVGRDQEEETFTPEEAQAIEKKLKMLGYM